MKTGKCNNCGHTRYSDDKYCGNCGDDKITYNFCNHCHHCYASNFEWDHKDFCVECGRDRKTALNTFPAKTFRWGRRKIRIKNLFS